MKVFILAISLLFSISSFASLDDPMAPLPFEEDQKRIDPDAPIFGSIQNSNKSTILFTPQANEMDNAAIPIYFHSTSNPQAICKKYGFSKYVEGSLIAGFANFNHEFIIVKAYDFKDDLRLIIPRKSNNNSNHKHMVNEISCY